jgi:hypothetical protein
MIYTRVQAVPPEGGSLNTVFDMTIVRPPKSSKYDVTTRWQERLTIVKTEVLDIQAPERKDCEPEEMVFLALYGVLGKERCKALLKRMDKNVGSSHTKRTPKAVPRTAFPRSGKAPPTSGSIRPPAPKKASQRIVYGKGTHTK